MKFYQKRTRTYVEKLNMDDLKKQILEIETSGNENSNKIIKLVAAFKALIKKTNDNEVNSFNNVYYNYINTF